MEEEKRVMKIMRRASKILGILIVVGILYFATSLSYQVSAATVSGSASDDTFATANQMNIGDTASGSITETNDLDNYRFQLNSAGCVTLDMTSYMQYYSIKLFDSSGEEIWITRNNVWTETVGYRRDIHKVYLEKGTYYMQINGYRWGVSDERSTGKYECRTSFVSSGVNNVESDNDFFTANNVTVGSTIIGQISENDDYDTYKFTLSKIGCVSLDMTSYMRYYGIKVFNSDGEEIWDTHNNVWTESVGYRCDGYKLNLEKGVYYMQINGYRWNSSDEKSMGKYVCRTSFASSNVSFDGDDNSFNVAKPISWNKAYTGQISLNDEFDTYKFVVPKDRTIAINMTSYMQYYRMMIYDSAGGEIWNTTNNVWVDKVGYRKDFHNVELKKGTYYMQIYGTRWVGDSEKCQGKYVFSIEPLTQSNCNHKYTDKWVSSTYFAKGYNLHRCEKCGKSYKDNYSPMKKLGEGYIYSYSSGKGKVYLQWYTVSDASGYQIRYCKSKSMKKGVVTKTIKGQSKYKMTIKKLSRKKRYYVQVRAYKKSGKKTVYGKWSSRRCLKTK